MWNLTTHKNFFLGIKNSYTATIFTKITRTKGKSDLSSSGEGFGTELTYRSMTERSSQIWDRNFWLFRWATAHLISDLTFTKEQTSIIFWQFLKKTAGKYFVVLCKHPRFFFSYIIVCFIITLMSLLPWLRLNKGTQKLNRWINISAISSGIKNRPGKGLE